MSRNKNIGIFDSGFGGLDVMRGIVRKLPEYDYVYLGDSARAPYGARSKKTIFDFSCQAVDFLFGKKCALIILACNTASSDALRRIQCEYLPRKYPQKKVLGVLIPAAEVAGKKTRNKKIGILATTATVRSNSFKRELWKVDPEIELFQKACPLLVPIIERGEQDSFKTEIILKKYLDPLIKAEVDTLVLGCTHYGLLEDKIRKIAGKDVKIISESRIIAGKLKNYLRRHPEVERKLGKNKKRVFYSSAPGKNFETLGSQFFGEKIKVKKVRLRKICAS